MNDRILGYICIIIPVIVLILFFSHILLNKPLPGETRVIEFESVSGLSFINIQDPVLLKGLQVGVVKAITQIDNNVYITTHSKYPQKIFNDYKVTVGAQGIMGDRFLNIEPGNSANAVIPENKTLTGTLLPSPPEAIAEIENLIKTIQTLKLITEKLLHGTDDQQSFIELYKKRLTDFDTTIGFIAKNSPGVSHNINVIMDTIQNLLKESFRLSSSLQTIVPSMLKRADTLLLSSSLLVNQLDSLLEDSENMVQLYKENDLSNIQEFITKTQSSLCSLRVMIKNVRADGIYLPVRLK